MAVLLLIPTSLANSVLFRSCPLRTALAPHEPIEVPERRHVQQLPDVPLQVGGLIAAEVVRRSQVGVLPELGHEAPDQDPGDALALLAVMKHIAEFLGRETFEFQHPTTSRQGIRYFLHEAELLRAGEDELSVCVPVPVDLHLEIAEEFRGILNFIHQ